MFLGLIAGTSLLPLCAYAQEQRDITPVSMIAFEELRVDTTLSIENGGEEIHGLKSGKKAFWWSFLGTTVPALVGIDTPAVLVPALLFGPSLGHFYAHRSGAAWAGIGIRSLAGIVVITGAFLESEENVHVHPTAASILYVVGGVIGGASLVWDIARAPRSAQLHNDELRQAHASMRIAPSFGVAGPGLCAVVTF